MESPHRSSLGSQQHPCHLSGQECGLLGPDGNSGLDWMN